MNCKNTGSSFDSWLREEGIYEEVTAAAIQRVLAGRWKPPLKKGDRQPFPHRNEQQNRPITAAEKAVCPLFSTNR